jgi:hypothetical protein
MVSTPSAVLEKVQQTISCNLVSQNQPFTLLKFSLVHVRCRLVQSRPATQHFPHPEHDLPALRHSSRYLQSKHQLGPGDEFAECPCNLATLKAGGLKNPKRIQEPQEEGQSALSAVWRRASST